MTKPPPTEEQKQIVFFILRAARHLQTGKTKLAAFLRGSQAQIVKNKELDRQIGYGALLWYDIPTITGFITQLEEMELLQSYLVQTGSYSYPILTLSEAGKKVLEEKREVPLQIRKVIKPITISYSERETLTLFKSGLPPAEIARRRELAISTVFGHLQRLIAVGELDARQCVAEAVIQKVLMVRDKVANKNSLKEIKELLPEEISYEEIKVVLADKTLSRRES